MIKYFDILQVSADFAQDLKKQAAFSASDTAK